MKKNDDEQDQATQKSYYFLNFLYFITYIAHSVSLFRILIK